MLFPSLLRKLLITTKECNAQLIISQTIHITTNYALKLILCSVWTCSQVVQLSWVLIQLYIFNHVIFLNPFKKETYRRAYIPSTSGASELKNTHRSGQMQKLVI